MMHLGAWRRTVGLLSLIAMSLGPVYAQSIAFPIQGFIDEVVDFDRPRIAVAPDGSFALAFEALIRSDTGFQSWSVLVQRYSASGSALGPVHRFDGESCGSFDIWLSDGMEHVELAFRPDGILVVLMQHSGEFQFGGDGQRSAEATLGAIDPSGQLIDLNTSGACVQQKLIFVGGDRQDRPRMALTPAGEMVITVDGFFGGSNLRNVAIRILDADLNEIAEELIPHDDPDSQQAFHMFPDIATNGTVLLSTWQECPVIDNQGNANECNIAAQFATVTAGGLQALGGNIPVSVGDPSGTLSVWATAAMNASGNSVVVWADTRTGFAGDIFGQRFNASGQPIGGNFQISTGQGEIYSRPEVAVLTDGRFMAVWMDSSSVGFRARGRRFGADGAPLELPTALSEEGGLNTGFPALASNGTTFLYTWAGARGNSQALFTNNLGLVVSREEEAPTLAAVPTLQPSYPNPFVEATTLVYALPETAPVTLTVYDVWGREVARLVDAEQTSGLHRVQFEAAGLPAGAYLVRLQQGAHLHAQLIVRK